MTIQTENYFVLLNGNSCLIELNESLFKTGYEFVSITNEELQGEGDFLKIDKKQNKAYLFLLDGGVGVEMGTPYFEEENTEIILLKEKVKTYKCSDSNNSDVVFRKEVTKDQPPVIEMLNSPIYQHEQLLSRINLYLEGDLFAIFRIERNIETRELYTFNAIQKYNTYIYPVELVSQKSEPLNMIVSNNFKFGELLDLAISANDEFAQIANDKLAFINLFVGLESVFNKGSSEPVQHILSRHSALLLSKDETQFNRIYKRVKELYGLRSAIVHGKNTQKELEKIERELPQGIIHARQLLKQVIRELIWMSFTTERVLTKEELFIRLNKMGI